jgi:hypothetical protein
MIKHLSCSPTPSSVCWFICCRLLICLLSTLATCIVCHFPLAVILEKRTPWSKSQTCHISIPTECNSIESPIRAMDKKVASVTWKSPVTGYYMNFSGGSMHWLYTFIMLSKQILQLYWSGDTRFIIFINFIKFLNFIKWTVSTDGNRMNVYALMLPNP